MGDNMKKQFIVTAVLSLFCAAVLVYSNALLKYSNDVINKERAMYLQLIHLRVPTEAKVVKLETQKYILGDCTLNCVLSCKNIDISEQLKESINKNGWIIIESNAKKTIYKKGKVLLIFDDSRGVYSLLFVDCRDQIVSFLYGLPLSR